jgi:hypothetical protein
MDQLIRCINCDEVFLKTPFDQRPEYEVETSGPAETYRIIERDDFQDFLRHHRGHLLEDLRMVENSFVSEKPYLEPVKTSYFKATNGKEKFVIKKSREKIGEPLKYSLISGDYCLDCARIEPQAEAIAKQLRKEFISLNPQKIEDFLKLFCHIAESVDIKSMERVEEESSHPLHVYYKLDDISVMYLLRNCRNIFKDHDYSAIEAFVHRHRDDGVLLLKAIFNIQITEFSKSQIKPLAASVHLRGEKAIEKK